MNLREAATLALEALENAQDQLAKPYSTEASKAITALIEALAEPPQEPICPECTAKVLYECVACSNNNYPPQRKPLTEEEIRAIRDTYYRRMGPIEFARAIEAAHGIGEKHE